ncbi:MAG: hypothetical protein IPJ65_44240 [Archangiaceae bacterium]|nr:hypothetical protein [Archangiaceae bacterium]
MLTLALTLVVSAAPAACTYKEPKEPQKIEDNILGGVEFTLRADPEWFRCAKKSGGKLELTWSVGAGGNFETQPPKAITSYGTRESLQDDVICKTPGAKQVQARLEGTGEMEKLAWSSTIVEKFCAKCQWSGDDNMLALHTGGNLSPKGSYTIDATFDPKWYECAKQGAELELRFFTGETAAEVKQATTPTHVVKGLTGPKVKKSFSKAEICKSKPKYLGYEFGGTGELAVLPGKGRAVQEAKCD